MAEAGYAYIEYKQGGEFLGIELLSIMAILVLLIIFVIGSFLPVNIGVLGFVAAFLMGSFCGGFELSDIYEVFPADLFIMLVGISFFFTIVQNSGAIHILAKLGLRLVRGNLGLIPWLMFMLSMILAGIGASGIAVVSIIAPIAMHLAVQNKMNELMMGIFVVMGVNAGSFTRLNIFGAIIEGIMEQSELSYNPTVLVLNCILYFSLISIAVFLVFGGFHLLKQKADISTMLTNDNRYDISSSKPDIYTIMALISTAILMLLVLVLNLNIGFAGLIMGLILSVIFPKKQKNVVGSMQWDVVFMISGIMTYIGVIEKLGIVDYITSLLSERSIPLLASLAVCYIGGLVSAFASTTGFLATIVPMALPIIESSTISCVGLLSAIAVSCSIVDLSPLSSAGAILLTNQQGANKSKFYRQLMFAALCFVVFAPLLAWLIFVVI